MKKIWYRVFSVIVLLGVCSIYAPAQDLQHDYGPIAAMLSPEPGRQAKLVDIVLESDPLMIKANSEEQAAQFLRDKNHKIIDYLVQRYPQYGVPDVDVNDPATTWFGLICAMYEGVHFRPLNEMIGTAKIADTGLPDWFECSLNVLGSSLGIREIIRDLGAFSYGTAWKVVKFFVKKYIGGWLGTAVALYNIWNECF
jgi:hypothetical protein